MEILEIIEQIGAYAGFAAVVGLAVLSALYFSQARDVKRLREWAGRAPERAAQAEEEAEARVRAATAAASRPPAQAGPAQPGPAQAQGPRPGQAPAAKPASAATAAGAAPPGGAAAANGAQQGAPPPIGTPPRVPQQTQILSPAALPRARWYRRFRWPAPRYVALIVTGLLVLGGAAAYGITELLADAKAPTPASEPGGGAQEQAGDGRQPTAAVDRSQVRVSVLNGTAISGLAAQIGEKVADEGFVMGNIDNATERAKAESVVLYAEGAKREAREVSEALGIPQIEQIDPESQRLGGNASVVVIVGADQTL